MADLIDIAAGILDIAADTITSNQKKSSDTVCPDWGSSKTGCLTTTLESCVVPCQNVVYAIYNATDDAGVLPSSTLPNPLATLNAICGQQFANMDACVHCSRRGFGLGTDSLGRLLLPWSITCSTWMDYGPARAYECWQGYAANKTAACNATVLLQVATSMGHKAAPASKSAFLAMLASMAFFGLAL